MTLDEETSLTNLLKCVEDDAFACGAWTSDDEACYEALHKRLISDKAMLVAYIKYLTEKVG